MPNLKNHYAASPWWMAALDSWGIALLNTVLQVLPTGLAIPALSLSQLKINQEVISLSVFIPFAVLYMDQPFKWDYVWAVALHAGRGIFRVSGLSVVALAIHLKQFGADHPLRPWCLA